MIVTRDVCADVHQRQGNEEAEIAAALQAYMTGLSGLEFNEIEDRAEALEVFHELWIAITNFESLTMRYVDDRRLSTGE